MFKALQYLIGDLLAVAAALFRAFADFFSTLSEATLHHGMPEHVELREDVYNVISDRAIVEAVHAS